MKSRGSELEWVGGCGGGRDGDGQKKINYQCGHLCEVNPALLLGGI